MDELVDDVVDLDSFFFPCWLVGFWAEVSPKKKKKRVSPWDQKTAASLEGNLQEGVDLPSRYRHIRLSRDIERMETSKQFHE